MLTKSTLDRELLGKAHQKISMGVKKKNFVAGIPSSGRKEKTKTEHLDLRSVVVVFVEFCFQDLEI